MSKGAEGYVIFHLPMKITKRKKWYLASCPILDVHSQGETRLKARENLVEAMALFFSSCFERKTLEAVLTEIGIALGPPTSALPEEDFVDVPVALFALGKKQADECLV
jgi:predicted RNase H-like HicB family nuclease